MHSKSLILSETSFVSCHEDKPESVKFIKKW